MRILYDSKNTLHKRPFGCITEGQSFFVSIHIPSSCGAHSVALCTEGEDTLSFELKKERESDGYDIFSAEIELKRCGLYFYTFDIADKSGRYTLYKEGYCDTNIGEGDQWQVSCIPKDFVTPDAFSGRVMYQIFPDRFCIDGECDISSKLTPYTIHQCTKEPPCHLPDSEGRILNNDFYGGNLRGIVKALPYLEKLGAGIIYLNPIFKAYSNHRYDTCDYKELDPMLGSKEDFVTMCKECHKRGMKIILDGVFSHTGSDSIYFDIKNRFGNGAYLNPSSPCRSWYTFRKDGSFESWWGIDTLPCVNELDKSYMEYIITSPDSVIRHWMSLGADGFRLDVADELPDEFITLLRSEVKKINPDALVLGEVWEDASNKISYGVTRRYFTASELDSVMNYMWRGAIIDFASEKISAKEFKNRILTVTENYPSPSVNCLMNSLSTHDTPRIYNVLSGADINMTRYQASQYTLSDEEIQRARERLPLAVMMLFFLPGNTCIYYGDEVGMTGFADPFNRAFMDWENKDYAVYSLYKSLAEIKNSHEVFRDGEISFVSVHDGMLVMERRNGTDTITCAVNMGKEAMRVTASPIICHNTTSSGDVHYVHKFGFVIY